MITKFQIFENIYIEEPDAYFITNIENAIKCVEAGHLLEYSENPMSTDWEIIEHAIGDNAKNMTEEEIDIWVHHNVNWNSYQMGVNLYEDIDNVAGYGDTNDIILGIKLDGDYAEFGDEYIFAEHPEECRIIKIYFNGEEITKEKLNELKIKLTSKKYNL